MCLISAARAKSCTMNASNERKGAHSDAVYDAGKGVGEVRNIRIVGKS